MRPFDMLHNKPSDILYRRVQYRITYFGDVGEIASVEIIDAVCDTEAVDYAKRGRSSWQRVEIWANQRLVAKLASSPRDPPARIMGVP